MNNTIAICIVAVLLVMSGTATAQVHQRLQRDSAGLAPRELNPVVVTGTGHHQHLAQTTTPVHVLSRRQIDEQGIATFEDAIVRMMPQLSMTPGSMGSFLRMNGLGGKYIVLLINGQRLTGDISSNVDLSRINMARVRRIEVLDGAASALYGSDAIGGVINIITDQAATELLSLQSDTRVAGEGQLSESVMADVRVGAIASSTSFRHDRADSYQLSPYMEQGTAEPSLQRTLAPLFTGYRSTTFGQRFTLTPSSGLSLYVGSDWGRRLTDRPATSSVLPGGTDYEMRYRSWRGVAGGIYKWSRQVSTSVDVTTDLFRYGREYDVATAAYAVGDYVQSKRQHTWQAQAKTIFAHSRAVNTIVGADWRREALEATSGSIDASASVAALYVQHERSLLRGLTATAGLRYDHHSDRGGHLSPKLAVMYNPGRLRLRASYSAGFRAPGLDELHYRYYAVSRGKPQVIFGNSGLRAEQSHYVSLGGEYRTAGWLFGVQAWLNNISHMVVRENIAVDAASLAMLQAEFPEMTADAASLLLHYSRYVNAQRGRTRGISVDASLRIASGLSVSASYVLTQARALTGGEWRDIERSVRHAATLSATCNHAWRGYRLSVNINGRVQSRTFYPDYEDAPGYGVWNLATRHTFELRRQRLLLEPALGVDNIFDHTDRRPNASLRRYALYSPGRRIVAGMRLRFR